jgi:hypothetical protein
MIANVPSTYLPSNVSCAYNVVNCEKCSKNTIQIDPIYYDISCVLILDQWIYLFKNKDSNTFQVSTNINVNNSNEMVLIEGNFTQTSNSTITINLSPKNSSSNNNFIFNVSGCVSLNGSIELVLNERPTNDKNFSIQFISYNCSDKANISDSQVKLSTNYEDSRCDVISQKVNNQPNSISISISSQINKNCGGNNF